MSMLVAVRTLPGSRRATSGPVRLVPEDPVGWLRPALPNGLPAPETGNRRLAIRATAVAALAVTVAYLAWRISSTLDLSTWFVGLPLLAIEIHLALGLLLLTVAVWDIDARPAAELVVTTDQRVAVLIPTLDESLDVLTPTIAAACAMRVEHETVVLDDGARPEVARLAADLGARYLARYDAANGRAGNLNAALEQLTADVVVVLHADSVASPDLLVHTLGYLADPKVALVQTPEGFYNTDSFEHAEGRRDRRPVHEQSLLHRVIQPGRNRWHGAFWTGTGAVIRVAALRDIGGVATGTVAPDLHTTLRLHRRGWRTVAHNEVLARGLAPTSAAIDQVQRQRRVAGVMQLIRVENPLFASGLTARQRLSWATSLLGWFDAWRWLAIVVLPIVVLFLGAAPLTAELPVFAAWFAVTYGLQAIALLALTRGCQRPFHSILLRVVRMTSDLKAVRHLVSDRPVATEATPKGRTSSIRRAARVSTALRTMSFLSVLGAVWFAVAVTITLFIGVALPWFVYAASAWLVADVIVLARATARVRELRFGGERRSSVRFQTAIAGSFDGEPCEILDLSLRGAGIRVARIAPGEVHQLTLDVDGRMLEIAASVRSFRGAGVDRTVVGLEFLPDQNLARAELALALYRTKVVPAGADGPVGSRVPDPGRTLPEPNPA